MAWCPSQSRQSGSLSRHFGIGSVRRRKKSRPLCGRRRSVAKAFGRRLAASARTRTAQQNAAPSGINRHWRRLLISVEISTIELHGKALTSSKKLFLLYDIRQPLSSSAQNVIVHGYRGEVWRGLRHFLVALRMNSGNQVQREVRLRGLTIPSPLPPTSHLIGKPPTFSPPFSRSTGGKGVGGSGLLG